MPYVKVGGLDLFYYDDDFSEPWRARDTILINHYGGGDSTLYNRWVKVLASDYRVIRWDRPGYGKSQAPASDYRLTPAGFLDDILGFMDALGLEKVHYVGDKAASAAGIAFAATFPERVQSLSLAMCFLPDDRLREIFRAQADSTIAKGSWLSAFEAPRGGRALEEGVEPMQDLYYRSVQANNPAHVLAAALRCVADPSFDVEPLLAKVTAPTLLLSPEDGAPLTNESQQELVASRIPSCERRVRPGSTANLPFLDAVWCAEQVHSFVARHAQNPPAR